MHSVSLHTCVSEPTTKICMKIDPQILLVKVLLAAKMQPRDPSFQQDKFYANIRGGSLERGPQMRVGWSKMAIFASFAIFSESSHLKLHLLYCAMQPLIASSMIPKQMTLNDYFALKSVLGSATNVLASPAFGQNCSKICRATHILSAAKMQPRKRIFWRYKVYADIRGGSLERGRQMRVGWSKMLIFASFARYIFRTFTSKATFIILCYVAHQWLFNDTEINDLE